MTANAALALLRAEKHVSVSAITTYAIRCPEQYFHRYIAHTLPTHKSCALAFGTSIHHALALFYKALMHHLPEPSPEDLAAAFSDVWTKELNSPIPVLFDKDDTADSLRDKGTEMIRVFHADAPRPYRVIGVEEAFSIELYDPTTGEVIESRLVGAIDAITEDENGQQTLLEHKTGAKKRSFEHDLQGAAYTFVAPHIGLDSVAGVTYQLLTKTKIPALQVETIKFTDADQRDFMRTVTGVLAAIRAGAFYPRRDQTWMCQGCPYAGPCLAG